jgi:adenylate kinase
MIILLFGAPGVGKGTQAQILAQNLGIAHLSTGDAFRTAIKAETEVGKLAKRYVDNGDLVPDDVTARIVQEAMQHPSFERGCILDGFPRTQNQAHALSTMLAEMQREISCVVNLDVDDATIIERLLARGRNDDTEEVIHNRLAVYRQETAPLVDLYTAQGLLVHVDGVGSVDEVAHRILGVVNTKE